MSIFRVSAWVIGIVTAVALAHTPNGPGTVALIWIFGACFFTVTWPTGRRAVSSHYEQKASK